MILALMGAVEPVDPISGGAGWVGAGLLGLVLAWLLLKHLPDKDRQIKDLVADKDKQISSLLIAKDEQILSMLKTKNEQLRALIDSAATQQNLMHTENQRQLERIIQHCKDEMAGMHQLFDLRMKDLGEDIKALGAAITAWQKS